MVVLCCLGLGTVAGAVYLVATARTETRTSAWNENETQVHEWCANIQAEVGAGKEFHSFQAIIAAAIDGELATPAEKPPATGTALDAWQASHARYLTSSYVQLLEGYPNELTVAQSIVVTTIEEAHARRPIAYPADARRAAVTIDRYLRTHC